MFEIKTGLNAPSDCIEAAFALDQMVYTPALCGEIENMKRRYEFCRDSFVFLYDDNTLAGYVNVFPVAESLRKQMTDKKDHRMRDDDVEPSEMAQWSTEDKNHLLILSVVIKPEYQKTAAIVELSEAFLTFLREKDAAGYALGSLFGYAVSLGGVKFMKRLRTSFLKHTDEEYNLFFGDEESVETLLEDGFLLNAYKKTFNDDMYIFIPFSSQRVKGSFEFLEKANARVTRDEEEREYTSGEDMSHLSFGDQFCKMLNRHVEYETTSEVFKSGQLQRFYIANPDSEDGAFYLACYDDDYDDIPLYEEAVHLFITAHRDTGLYIATIALPNNTYCPTQLIDQMSSGHLDIARERGGEYMAVESYIEDAFKLEKCGEPKCVVCLSNEPEDRNELAYLLSGETYYSKHINYKIRQHHLDALLADHSVYDYYKSYISDSVIAFVFEAGHYSEDLFERLDDSASVLFIVEIVLFQNTAILRTNRKVVEELSDEDDQVSQENIDELYIEFGKTMKFWNADIFKYPYSQKEANEAIRSFGIQKTLDDYYRNQQFLDRMIELKSNITEQESDRTMNNILFFLSLIEGSSITVAAFVWAMGIARGNAFMEMDGGRVIWIALFIAVCLLCRFSKQIVRSIRTRIKRRKNRKEREARDYHLKK